MIVNLLNSNDLFVAPSSAILTFLDPVTKSGVFLREIATGGETSAFALLAARAMIAHLR